MKADLTIPAGDLMSRLVLTIQYSAVFKVRLWMGLAMLRLAAAIMGCGIEIKERETK
jgi:hypothetical protein